MSELTSLRPTQTVSVRDVFGIDTDLRVPAFAERDEHVPEIDSCYRFNPAVTLALLAFAQQGAHGHVQVLAQQDQHRRLHGGHGMDGGAQIEGLQPAPAAVAVSKLLLHALQHALVRANRLADDQRARVFQRLADLFAAGHLAHAGVPGVVGEDQEVAREKRAVRTAQVQQHAVAAGDGDDAQLGDAGGVLAGLGGGHGGNGT